MIVQDIDLLAVQAMLQNATSAVVVDVREPWEFEEFNVGGRNIPLADIRQRRDELSEYQTIVVICANGTRSRVAAKDYCRAEAFKDKQIYHLKGGILEVDED